ncbi:MAG: hypothetical protein ACJ798_16915 [Phenylobacterium sp.]
MVATTIPEARTRSGYFYVWMAAACALIAFGGFAETYWLQVAQGTFVGGPLLHLHGLLFSAWTLLFLSQTWLAANDRLEHHRAWGLVGISLATALVFVGMATAIASMTARIPVDGDIARRFLVVPVTALGGFAVMFVAAVANINRPDWHKRFMLAGTVSLLNAAIARFFFVATTGGGPGARPGLTTPPPLPATIVAGGIGDLLLVIGAVYDWRTRGRVHPAYWVGGAVVLGLQVLRVPLGGSSAWLAFADSLGKFAH